MSYMGWIGTTQIRSRPTVGYANYETARDWVCVQGWTTRAEFNAAAKRGVLPHFVARAPEMVYKNCGWQGWPDWLGNGKRRRGNRRPFAEARLWARAWALERGVRTAEQWVAAHQGCRIPVDIPSRPDDEYRDLGWLSWGDWLATGRTRRNNQPWRPFLKARAFVHRLQLASWDEWRAYARSPERPEDIPAAPYVEYLGHGWVSMEDWLGLPATRQYGRSRIEQLLPAELAVLLGGGELNGSLALPERRRDRVDYLHRELGLVIEYDGERWHRVREEHDRAKSRALRQAGWKLIRVREAPLPCLHPDKVQVGRCPSVRTAVSAILHRLFEWRIGTHQLQRRWRH